MDLDKSMIKDVENLHEALPSLMSHTEKCLVIIKSTLLKYLINNTYIKSIDDNLQKKFTINKILYLWSGTEQYYFDEEILSLDLIVWEKIKEFIYKGSSYFGENSNIIGRVYELFFHISQKKKKGIFYTPKEIITHMISLLEISWEKSFTIIDPACGCGFFLSEIYDAIIKYNKFVDTEELHNKIIGQQLYGVDSDIRGVLVARLVLSLKNPKFVPVNHIYNEDSLFFDINKEFDYVIGNPPYIGHKLLDNQYMEKLKIQYKGLFYDKGDISYCFFKRGVDLLKENGKIIYITSRYFIESMYGYGLREYIKDKTKIDMIIDFNGNRLISGAKVDLAIIKITKSCVPNTRVIIYKLKQDLKEKNYEYIYINSCNYQYFEINQQKMNSNGWVLIDKESEDIIEKINKKSQITLGTICSSYQGVITGCDKAFIIDDEIINNFTRKEIIKPWIKSTDIFPFGIRHNKKYLLYTDELNEVSQDDYLIEHLLPFKEKLSCRRECMKGIRKWFHLQWGRNKQSFQNKKIIFPYKSADNRFAIDSMGYYFSADIYALILENNFLNNYEYEFLAGLLNSKLYEFYFKTFAKKLGGSLYEYYPNTLMRLRIPIINSRIKEKFKNECINENNIVDVDKSNDFFYDLFEIGKQERSKIEKHIGSDRNEVDRLSK